MTSEVCVMNRLAVVIAADSATTVSRWVNGSRETRYFKGANKIFQLSNHHPVGLMIYDSADILRVPWELVAKEFRAGLGSKSFNNLDGYAQEFFAFLESDARLFPQSVQEEVFVGTARAAGIAEIYAVVRGPGTDDATHAAALDSAIAVRLAQVNAAPLAPGVAAGSDAAALGGFRAPVTKAISDTLSDLAIVGPTQLDPLVELAITTIFKDPEKHLGTTGLVLAGYGDHDIFPAFIEYISCGLILGKHVAREENRQKVDHDLPAAISSFAQTSMSDTFQLGFSRDIFIAAMDAFGNSLDEFADAVAKEAGGDLGQVPDLPALKASARKKASEQWLERSRTDHIFPMRRVISVLSIEEMAELAETLVSLQSLKEKVTKPSEEVGGPVDVAVITRNEGLLWIKRKHFFDPALNPRFMHRLGSAYK